MLNLYVQKGCPYCQKVINFLDNNRVKYNLLDVANEENYMQLIKLGEKDQVPFLFDSDNDVELYESEHIIQYLQTII